MGLQIQAEQLTGDAEDKPVIGQNMLMNRGRSEWLPRNPRPWRRGELGKIDRQIPRCHGVCNSGGIDCGDTGATLPATLDSGGASQDY
ncbi:uncharacterized protein G2W53_004779 [Senna tora]|uniref:Uncharacterized protein n=1 Tax=Senna tora TaxID=362788 RepID=A0A834XED1_9FABA|nr:uncharacterized protein G2W53_004779 [Senna tora]